jgi:hypothetical protein
MAILLELYGKRVPMIKISKHLNISIQTSGYWRHRILASFSQYVPEQLLTEMECDELELGLSSKGSRTLEKKTLKKRN